MNQTNKNTEDTPEKHDISISLLEKVTPLARKINCLDIDRVADVCIKSIPKLDEKFLNKVEDYQPDKIFVTDIAIVDQDFVDKAKVRLYG